MNSRVYPKYKIWKHCFQVYRVTNWAEYARALVRRGDITLWISEEVVEGRKPASSGNRGGQKKSSDHAIETALMLRLVFKLPLRQAEAFLRSILSLMDLNLEAPDHTTLSRRSQQLDVALNLAPVNEPIHLIVDSTGLLVDSVTLYGSALQRQSLSIVGEGEWATAKYGARGRRSLRHDCDLRCQCRTGCRSCRSTLVECDAIASTKISG